jgi:hypothetical protein
MKIERRRDENEKEKEKEGLHVSKKERGWIPNSLTSPRPPSNPESFETDRLAARLVGLKS